MGYSPGITDHYRTDFDPGTHTYKQIPLGLDLFTAYLFDSNMGIGADLHWGVIDKMIIRNSEAEIVLEEWDGTVSQLNFCPYFLYAPLQRENMNLILGIGISYTMNFYVSDYGNDMSEHYFGFSLNIRYSYFISESLFLNAGMKYNLEFIGLWDSEGILNILQSHYYPVLALGIRL
jgi:hypothetical protein